MNNIIQFKISLSRIKPLIWRRVLVDESISFSQFHYLIQAAMGWCGGHMYEFNCIGKRIGELYEDDEEYGAKLYDADKLTLKSVIGDSKAKFKYTYDFGDDWLHDIKPEKFLPNDEKIKYPICIDGAQNCPPEDCGGIWGFETLLETISNKKHPEHKEMLEWLGGGYDPVEFDKEGINKRLGNG